MVIWQHLLATCIMPHRMLDQATNGIYFKSNRTQSALLLGALNTNNQKVHQNTQWITLYQTSVSITILKTLSMVLKSLKLNSITKWDGRKPKSQIIWRTLTRFQILELMRTSSAFKMDSNGLKMISAINGPQPKIPTDTGASQRLPVPLLILILHELEDLLN